MVHTIAAIDMALWDIAGKLWSVPVYRLLGGPTRDRIRVYPTPKASKGAAARHLRALAATRPTSTAWSRRSRRPASRSARTARSCSTPTAAVPPATLIQFAAAIKPYDVLFIEEPAVPGNIEVFKRLKEQIRIPLATGERDRTIWELLPYLQERCIDILQPDCCHTGGITPDEEDRHAGRGLLTCRWRRTAPPAFLGIAASLHVVASIPVPDPRVLSRQRRLQLPGVTRMACEVDKDGYIGLPPGPGLGVEVDENKLTKKPRSRRPTSGRAPQLKDGSIADY